MADGSLSQFKVTLARKKARKVKSQEKFDRRKLGFKNSNGGEELNFPKVSEEELETIKESIRQRARAEKKVFIFWVLFVVLAILFVVFLTNGLPNALPFGGKGAF